MTKGTQLCGEAAGGIEVEVQNSGELEVVLLVNFEERQIVFFWTPNSPSVAQWATGSTVKMLSTLRFRFYQSPMAASSCNKYR